MLAIYCYRRAHLASIGLAIAAECDKDELVRMGGTAGAILFDRSRQPPRPRPAPSGFGRRKISLGTCAGSPFAPVEDGGDPIEIA